MDANHFDRITRTVRSRLTVSTRRRTLLRGAGALGAAVLGGAALLDSAAARKKNRSKKSKGDLCLNNGSHCRTKSKKCKAGNCLQTPFSIEATWGNPSSQHDTFLFVPNAPGATLPFPYLDYGCHSGEVGGGDLYPFAFVSQDAKGPGPEITFVAFLMDGKYEFWMQLDHPAPAGELTVTLRNPNGNVIRSWSSPENLTGDRAWHVFDIQGERRSITSVNTAPGVDLPGIAHASSTMVCG